MAEFTVHTIRTAPEASKPVLENSLKRFKMIPNLHGVMAEAPELLKAYISVGDLFENSSLTAEELTVVWQAINVEHNCTYCVPAHTGIAHSMKVDPKLIEALRDGSVMTTDKLQVLHETTLKITRQRGVIEQEDMDRFFAVGYGQRQLLEIILGLSMKVMSNYVNHVAQTPLDKEFEKFSWSK